MLVRRNYIVYFKENFILWITNNSSRNIAHTRLLLTPLQTTITKDLFIVSIVLMLIIPVYFENVAESKLTFKWKVQYYAPLYKKLITLILNY